MESLLSERQQVGVLIRFVGPRSLEVVLLVEVPWSVGLTGESAATSSPVHQGIETSLDWVNNSLEQSHKTLKTAGRIQ